MTLVLKGQELQGFATVRQKDLATRCKREKCVWLSFCSKLFANTQNMNVSHQGWTAHICSLWSFRVLWEVHDDGPERHSKLRQAPPWLSCRTDSRICQLQPEYRTSDDTWWFWDCLFPHGNLSTNRGNLSHESEERKRCWDESRSSLCPEILWKTTTTDPRAISNGCSDSMWQWVSTAVLTLKSADEFTKAQWDSIIWGHGHCHSDSDTISRVNLRGWRAILIHNGRIV